MMTVRIVRSPPIVRAPFAPVQMAAALRIPRNLAAQVVARHGLDADSITPATAGAGTIFPNQTRAGTSAASGRAIPTIFLTPIFLTPASLSRRLHRGMSGKLVSGKWGDDGANRAESSQCPCAIRARANGGGPPNPPQPCRPARFGRGFDHARDGRGRNFSLSATHTPPQSHHSHGKRLAPRHHLSPRTHR